MKNITILLLTILCFTACSKDDDTGSRETVRCKVNGKEWDAYSYTAGGPFGQGTGATDLQYYIDTEGLTLRGVRKLEDQSINQSINISAKPARVGVNEIRYITEEFKDWLNESGCIFYNLDTLSENTIEIIALDSINRTIEGTFQFSAINECNDTVRITEGYFNLEYRF